MKRNICHAKKLQRGMSLVEVLIFIVILTIVLVSLIGITTSVIRQSRTNYSKTFATHHAQQLAEWLRIQKDVVGWNQFYSTVMTAPANFCVNDEIRLDSVLGDLLSENNTANCDGTGINGVSPQIYNRTVAFTQEPGANTSNDSMEVVIRVEWQEAGNQLNFVETSTVYAPL